MSEYIKEIRKKVGSFKLLAPGTACIIVNEQREVLLLLRSDTKTWGLIGGFIDIGETVIESLTREAREESGLEIAEPRLFGIYSGPDFDSTYTNGDETASITLAFLVERYSGELVNSSESEELRFFALNELPEPVEKGSMLVLNDYRDYCEERRCIPTIL
jgi:ADP-ribose pyrophosphatase YjhB (NUDIX family)